MFHLIDGGWVEILEGVRLMIIGMSTVIGFLCTMVISMYASAAFFRVYHQYFPESLNAPVPLEVHADRDLAIAIAVAAHQKNFRRGA